MFEKLFYQLRLLFSSNPLSGWWINLRYYWLGWNKTPLIIIAVATTFIGGLTLISLNYAEQTGRKQDLVCLALNVYHEARGEPVAGQYAVAEVTMNRVASKHYPNTICDVVYQQNWDRRRGRYVSMFSWTELEANSNIEHRALKRALDIAETVYDKRHKPRVKGALFYHAKYIKPRWAKRKKPIAVIGKHIFYR